MTNIGRNEHKTIMLAHGDARHFNFAEAFGRRMTLIRKLIVDILGILDGLPKDADTKYKITYARGYLNMGGSTNTILTLMGIDDLISSSMFVETKIVPYLDKVKNKVEELKLKEHGEKLHP